MSKNHARLHVVDAEVAAPAPAHSHEDDSFVTASSVARDMAYGFGAAIFGVSVIAIAGAAFAFVPDAPALGMSPWLSGSQSVIKIAALCLAVAAFAVPFHIAIWLPAKVAFATAHIQNKLARWSLEAVEAGVIAFAAVCAIGLPVSALWVNAPVASRGVQKVVAAPAASTPKTETKAAPAASVAAQQPTNHHRRKRH